MASCKEALVPFVGAETIAATSATPCPNLPCHALTFELQTGAATMRGQPMRMMVSSLLACSAFALCAFAGQPAAADGQGGAGAFTKGSLQGRYAYVNNTGNVASLGPIIFDGHGGLKLKIITNTPCENPSPGCARGLGSFNVSGTYTVRSDGTGVAKIDFPEPTGPVTYDFLIVEANGRGALQVFAAGRSGGLAGQLIAPTWTKTFDR
jgi:hypothetical protein